LSTTLKDYSARIVGLFLVIEAVTVYFLWGLNPTNKIGQEVFGVFLAIDLVSFATISYVYRVYKRGDGINRGLLLAGCVMILILVYASLAL
jgi:hypothetical protein